MRLFFGIWLAGLFVGCGADGGGSFQWPASESLTEFQSASDLEGDWFGCEDGRRCRVLSNDGFRLTDDGFFYVLEVFPGVRGPSDGYCVEVTGLRYRLEPNQDGLDLIVDQFARLRLRLLTEPNLLWARAGDEGSYIRRVSQRAARRCQPGPMPIPIPDG